MSKRRFVLVIEDDARPDDSPLAVRLRIVAKRLLRSWCFTLVSIVELPSGERPATEGEGDR